MDKSQEALTAIIAEHMKKLPPEVKSVITDFDWLNTLQEISSRYKLNIEQQGILGTEVTMSILGITHPDNFSHELRNSLNIGKEETENMIVDINEKIFRPVRAKLIGVYSKNQEEKARLISGELSDKKQSGDTQNNDTNNYAGEKISLAEELTRAMKPEESKPLPQLENTQVFSKTLEEKIPPTQVSEPKNEPLVIKPTTEEDKKVFKEETVYTPASINSIDENITQSKLGNLFSLQKKDTDHTLKKDDENKTKEQSSDPYREII